MFERQILQSYPSHEREPCQHPNIQAGTECQSWRSTRLVSVLFVSIYCLNDWLLMFLSLTSRLSPLLGRYSWNRRCDACPAGQKQTTGGSTFCEDCGALRDRPWRSLEILTLTWCTWYFCAYQTFSFWMKVPVALSVLHRAQ